MTHRLTKAEKASLGVCECAFLVPLVYFFTVDILSGHNCPNIIFPDKLEKIAAKLFKRPPSSLNKK
jgi:hypothetical protein